METTTLTRTVGFMRSPKAVLKQFLRKQRPEVAAIFAAVDFSRTFYRELAFELEKRSVLRRMQVRDPQTRKTRPISFRDLVIIEQLLINGDEEVPSGGTLDDIDTRHLDLALHRLGYTDRHGEATLHALQRLPGTVGRSFSKAVWEDLARRCISFAKDRFIAELRRLNVPEAMVSKLQNRVDEHFARKMMAAMLMQFYQMSELF